MLLNNNTKLPVPFVFPFSQITTSYLFSLHTCSLQQLAHLPDEAVRRDFSKLLPLLHTLYFLQKNSVSSEVRPTSLFVCGIPSPFTYSKIRLQPLLSFHVHIDSSFLSIRFFINIQNAILSSFKKNPFLTQLPPIALDSFQV